MLLLLVVDGDLADGILQADGDLVVVRDALSRALVVFVEAHLVVIDDTVHVMPGSEETHTQLRHSTHTPSADFMLEHLDLFVILMKGFINPSGKTNPDAPA